MATFTKAKWGSIPSYPLSEEFKDSMSYLRHLVREGARRRLNLSDIPSGDILCRVNRELDVISKGFPDYLLIVRDYMRFARAKPGFMDINNGPICGSLVAYLLGFTRFNPLDRGLRDAAVAFLGRNGRARYGYMRCYDNKYTFDC